MDDRQTMSVRRRLAIATARQHESLHSHPWIATHPHADSLERWYQAHPEKTKLYDWMNNKTEAEKEKLICHNCSVQQGPMAAPRYSHQGGFPAVHKQKMLWFCNTCWRLAGWEDRHPLDY